MGTATVTPHPAGGRAPWHGPLRRLPRISYCLRWAELTTLLRGIYEARDPDEGDRARCSAAQRPRRWSSGPPGSWLDSSTVVRGHEELAEFFGRLEDAFGEFHFEPERFEERRAGGGRRPCGSSVPRALQRHSAESRPVGHLLDVPGRARRSGSARSTIPSQAFAARREAALSCG